MKRFGAIRIIMRCRPGRSVRLAGRAAKIILVMSAALSLTGPGIAHDYHASTHLATSDSSPTPRKETLRLPNVEVFDQHGQIRHFRHDLIKGRTVVVNFIYTHCSAVCSPITSNLKRVRDLLGPELANRIAFISITVAAEDDRPEGLLRFQSSMAFRMDGHSSPGSRKNCDRSRKAFQWQQRASRITRQS